jgi:hypothetical protein
MIINHNQLDQVTVSSWLWLIIIGFPETLLLGHFGYG